MLPYQWQNVDKLLCAKLICRRCPQKACHFDFLFMFLSRAFCRMETNSEWLSASIQQLAHSMFGISLLSNTEIWIKGNYCWQYLLHCRSRSSLLLHKIAFMRRGQLRAANNVLEIENSAKRTKNCTENHGQEMVKAAISEFGITSLTFANKGNWFNPIFKLLAAAICCNCSFNCPRLANTFSDLCRATDYNEASPKRGNKNWLPKVTNECEKCAIKMSLESK